MQATTDPHTVGAVDLVLFWVKCYHTENAAKLTKPLVGPETVVASFQNGWGNGDVLARFFAHERIVVGVTYDSGTVLEPGRVAHTYKAETLVGPYAGESLDDANWIADTITNAGLSVTPTPSIRVAIWEKLVMTAATLPTAALTGLTSGALGTPGPMLDLIDSLASEAVSHRSRGGPRAGTRRAARRRSATRWLATARPRCSRTSKQADRPRSTSSTGPWSERRKLSASTFRSTGHDRADCRLRACPPRRNRRRQPLRRGTELAREREAFVLVALHDLPRLPVVLGLCGMGSSSPSALATGSPSFPSLASPAEALVGTRRQRPAETADVVGDGVNERAPVRPLGADNVVHDLPRRCREVGGIARALDEPECGDVLARRSAAPATSRNCRSLG